MSWCWSCYSSWIDVTSLSQVSFWWLTRSGLCRGLCICRCGWLWLLWCSIIKVFKTSICHSLCCTGVIQHCWSGHFRMPRAFAGRRETVGCPNVKMPLLALLVGSKEKAVPIHLLPVQLQELLKECNVYQPNTKWTQVHHMPWVYSRPQHCGFEIFFKYSRWVFLLLDGLHDKDNRLHLANSHNCPSLRLASSQVYRAQFSLSLVILSGHSVTLRHSKLCEKRGTIWRRCYGQSNVGEAICLPAW